MLSLQPPSFFTSTTSRPPLDLNILHNSSSRSRWSETKRHDMSGEVRTSRAALCSSLLPLLDLLRKSGVSNDSIDELCALLDKEEYVIALQRATTYANCPSNSSLVLSAYVLLLGCWNALCRLSLLRYKSESKRYQKMRHCNRPTTEWYHVFATTTLASSIEAAGKTANDAGELWCTCQRELILLRKKANVVLSAL